MGIPPDVGINNTTDLSALQANVQGKALPQPDQVTMQKARPVNGRRLGSWQPEHGKFRANFNGFQDIFMSER
jgi:hypothetical protein